MIAPDFVTSLLNCTLIDESWSNLLNAHAHRNTQTGPTKIGNILSYRVPFNYAECCWTTIKNMRGNPRSQHKKICFMLRVPFSQGELKDLLSQNCFLSRCLFNRAYWGALMQISNIHRHCSVPALWWRLEEKIKMFMKTNSKSSDFK